MDRDVDVSDDIGRRGCVGLVWEPHSGPVRRRLAAAHRIRRHGKPLDLQRGTGRWRRGERGIDRCEAGGGVVGDVMMLVGLLRRY